MAYRIIVTPRAARDLVAIDRYIASHDPASAFRIRTELVAPLKLLSNFSQAGRMVPEFRAESIREIIKKPYRIIYRVDSVRSVIYVLRFWHSARGTPKIKS